MFLFLHTFLTFTSILCQNDTPDWSPKVTQGQKWLKIKSYFSINLDKILPGCR